MAKKGKSSLLKIDFLEKYTIVAKKGAKMHMYNLKEGDIEYLYTNTRLSKEDIIKRYE